MFCQIEKTEQLPVDKSVVYILHNEANLEALSLTKTELNYVKKCLDEEKELIEVNSYFKWSFVYKAPKEDGFKGWEKTRKIGADIAARANKLELDSLVLVDMEDTSMVKYMAEGIALANYKFVKYFTDEKKRKPGIKNLFLLSTGIDKSQANELDALSKGVYLCRDLVNEPYSFLTAEHLAQEIALIGEEAGYSLEVFNKKKIEELEMGGLLAVNKGSVDPPTFSIMTWKPENAVNEKPLVLVGKGVVFDTGGLSLKPTAGSMDEMKSDMGGAAAVIGAFFAIAKNKLPVHVIGLIPATDNRPGGNAYAPQDVIKMHNGMTVEVLNTDAEGRMILADALSYSDKYDPELVVELSTLTGAAHAAIGKYGVVGMGNASEEVFSMLNKAGEDTYERIARFPFWEEYNDMLKSDVADLKNIGGKVGGAITAGKFLEHFTKSPYVHLDIAGPAFLDGNDSYRTKGGSGAGVRLIYDFVKKWIEK